MYINGIQTSFEEKINELDLKKKTNNICREKTKKTNKKRKVSRSKKGGRKDNIFYIHIIAI